jgi:hypothetical protein
MPQFTFLTFALLIVNACASSSRPSAAVPSSEGGVVVRAYWLSDSTRATTMIQVRAHEGTPAERGALLQDQRVDSTNVVLLSELPARNIVLTVLSIGFDRQLIPVAIRPGCPDTITVWMPLSMNGPGPYEPRVGRWQIARCTSGA